VTPSTASRPLSLHAALPISGPQPWRRAVVEPLRRPGATPPGRSPGLATDGLNRSGAVARYNAGTPRGWEKRDDPLPKAQTPVIAQAPIPPRGKHSGETGRPRGSAGAEGARSGGPPSASKLSGKRTEGHPAAFAAPRPCPDRLHVPEHPFP